MARMTNNTDDVLAMTRPTILIPGVNMVGLVTMEIHQTYTNPGVATLGIFLVGFNGFHLLILSVNLSFNYLEHEINACGTGDPSVSRPLHFISHSTWSKYFNPSSKCCETNDAVEHHSRCQEQLIHWRLFKSWWSVDLSQWYICCNIWKFADAGSLRYVLILFHFAISHCICIKHFQEASQFLYSDSLIVGNATRL